MFPVARSRIGKILLFLFLESFAVLLALYQYLSGVQTDEAKYLLNIPYPHPPLARTLFHALESFPQQELIIRVLLATLLLQAVWIVASLAKGFSAKKQIALCGFWLLSASVLLQAGTVMMAPITALQGLLLVWLLFRGDVSSGYPGWVAILWLVSLFTAYQAILYAPIVFVIFWRNKEHFLTKITAFSVPVVLVIFYVLVSPLALASFVSAGGQNTMLSIGTVMQQVASSWLFSGSIIFSVVGTVAAIRSKNAAIIGSFVLTVAFLCVSFRSYYGILFLPLFVAGVIAHKETLRKETLLLALQIAVVISVFSTGTLHFYGNAARMVLATVNHIEDEGVVLIAGSFGHQWQYESRSPVYRYREHLLPKAKAVVCLDECPDVSGYGFYQAGNLATEVWVRKMQYRQ